jgi:hypothetical protein
MLVAALLVARVVGFFRVCTIKDVVQQIIRVDVWDRDIPT